MLSKGLVIGTVVSVRDDRNGTIVLIDTGGGKTVAGRTYGKSAEQSRGLSPGVTAILEGYIGSREYNGKFYTDFNVTFIRSAGPQGAASEDYPF